MSGSSSSINLGTIGASAGIPNLNVADIPANIRTGGKRAMQAYSEGLAFEDILVSELTQQLSQTMDGSGSAGSSMASGTGATAAGSPSGGLLGAAAGYASLMPQALTSSIMSGGGLGMAEQFAQELDPALLNQGSKGQHP